MGCLKSLYFSNNSEVRQEQYNEKLPKCQICKKYYKTFVYLGVGLNKKHYKWTK